MRVTTWNINGIRAAIKKGFWEKVDEIEPDVLLLQEIRALPEQLAPEHAQPAGWHVHWHPAEKKGYSGVAVLSRAPITFVRTGLTDDAPDTEGRVLHVRVQGIDLCSVYLPSGSSGTERQTHKEEWMARFRPWADALRTSGRPALFAGDLNIAHTENDIHNPTGNKKNSGFLPHERAWMGELIASGWHDVYREHFGDRKGPYSWWSNRGKARELDRGWRIDYLLTTADLAARTTEVSVDRQAGITISDHAPVTVTLS